MIYFLDRRRITFHGLLLRYRTRRSHGLVENKIRRGSVTAEARFWYPWPSVHKNKRKGKPRRFARIIEHSLSTLPTVHLLGHLGNTPEYLYTKTVQLLPFTRLGKEQDSRQDECARQVRTFPLLFPSTQRFHHHCKTWQEQIAYGNYAGKHGRRQKEGAQSLHESKTTKHGSIHWWHEPFWLLSSALHSQPSSSSKHGPRFGQN